VATHVKADLRARMEPPRSVEDTVTETLRWAIESGRLAPGARLGQADLAEELGVSRIPLRDAFRRLASEGLIDLDSRRGARVVSLSPADIAEIYEMRLLLETTCARYAVDNLDVTAATALVNLSLEMDRMADDLEAGPAVRLDFYSRLYAHADRPRMRETILRLRSQVGRYHRLNPAGHAGHAHVELRKAIRARNGERAAEVVAAHLVEARDDLLQSLKTAST
jgi:DNA-binding GntR family transcriptional regulator